MQEPVESSRKSVLSKYNPGALRKAVQDGLSVSQILEKLGIQNRQTLRKHLAKLIQEDKKFYEIHGLFTLPGTNVKINKGGVLRIVLKNFDLGEMKCKEGDEFGVTIEKNRIILEKLT